MSARAMGLADLLAVETLSVRVPAEVSIQILHGRLGRNLSQLLERIPADVALGEEDAEPHLRPGAPASVAWEALEGLPDVGWVTAGKLLARKRPHLLPVYDDVMRCAIGAPTSFWTVLHEAVAEDATQLRARIRRLRAEAAVPAEVSDLRVVDVVVWMGHRRAHAQPRCPHPGTSALDRPDGVEPLSL